VSRDLVVLTHMFPRWLTDFGNVVTYLDREDYRFQFHTSPPSGLPFRTWDDPTYYADYKARLPRGTTVSYLPYRRGSISPVGLIRMAKRAFDLGKASPDGLFMFWSMVLIISMGLPLRLMNRKCLFMVTGLGSVLGDRTSKFRLYRAIVLVFYRFLFSGRNSRVLTHNQEDKDFLVRRTGVRPDKVVVTPGCGVDPRFFPFFEELPKNEPPIIYVPTRLVKQKGVLEAGEASRLLNERGIAHQMWFTGGFEPFYSSISISQEEMERMTSGSASIKFLGYVDSVVPLLKECDIVCYPTYYPEGVPTALLEAASCGRPAVTTDNVGCRDISIHEETALVVPPRDAVALADALERMIGDPALQERLRRNAHARFSAGFTKDICLERTLDAFESMGVAFEGEQSSEDIRLMPAAA